MLHSILAILLHCLHTHRCAIATATVFNEAHFLLVEMEDGNLSQHHPKVWSHGASHTRESGHHPVLQLLLSAHAGHDYDETHQRISYILQRPWSRLN